VGVNEKEQVERSALLQWKRRGPVSSSPRNSPKNWSPSSNKLTVKELATELRALTARRVTTLPNLRRDALEILGTSVRFSPSRLPVFHPGDLEAYFNPNTHTWEIVRTRTLDSGRATAKRSASSPLVRKRPANRQAAEARVRRKAERLREHDQMIDALVAALIYSTFPASARPRDARRWKASAAHRDRAPSPSSY
jgi:hypothetical protein